MHSPLSSSKRLVRILRTIVFPMASILPTEVANPFHGGTVRRQLVRRDDIGLTVAFQQLSKEFQCGLAVMALGNIAFQHLALMIHRAPQVVDLAVDLHKDPVQIPLPIQVAADSLSSAATDFGGKKRAEPVPPKPDRLVADIYPVFVEKVLDVSKRKREPNIPHDRQSDNLRRCFEVAERVGFAHRQMLRSAHNWLKPASSDNATGGIPIHYATHQRQPTPVFPQLTLIDSVFPRKMLTGRWQFAIAPSGMRAM